MRPALTWRALDGDLVAGEVSARLRPDPATFLVAVDRASGQYAGLVRIWRNRAGPRLGLIATLTQYRRRGVARALLGRAFAVLAARGDTSVVGEVDDTNVTSLPLLTGLGARRYGGNVELIRRQPARSARHWPDERRPSAGCQDHADPAQLSRRAAHGNAVSPRTRIGKSKARCQRSACYC